MPAQCPQNMYPAPLHLAARYLLCSANRYGSSSAGCHSAVVGRPAPYGLGTDSPRGGKGGKNLPPSPIHSGRLPPSRLHGSFFLVSCIFNLFLLFPYHHDLRLLNLAAPRIRITAVSPSTHPPPSTLPRAASCPPSCRPPLPWADVDRANTTALLHSRRRRRRRPRGECEKKRQRLGAARLASALCATAIGRHTLDATLSTNQALVAPGFRFWSPSCPANATTLLSTPFLELPLRVVTRDRPQALSPRERRR